MLAIRAWKADGYEPLGLRRHLPPDQDQEFHDLLSYFRSLGLTLAFVAPMWRQAIEKHAARYAWLLTLELTEIYVSALSSYILAHTRQPITESQHAERLAAGRAEMLPLGDLAELLADGNQDWAEKDMEDGDVSERAFARVQKEKKALLRSLVDRGTISGRRKGKSLELNAGSFYDWLAEPTPVFPDWGLEFEIVPDDREDEVRRENAARDHAQSMIQRAFRGTTERRLGKEPSADDLYAAVDKQLIEGVITDSVEIRAAEKLVAAFQQRLGGEDPLDPSVRETLDYCRDQLAEMRERLGIDAEEAIEDCDQNLKALRDFVEANR